MEERADELKFLLAAETGQPPTIVDMMQYGAAMSSFQYFAGAADKFTWRDFRDGVYGQTMVLREPIGVVAAVTAWNVPFFLAANKLGPALLAGCTIVVKPAAETPLSLFAMADIFAEAGLPEGVLSVVPGGPDTGRALTANPEIDKFTFTGSSAVGKEIAKIAAEKLKPCSLELGGKSAAIILEDADLDSTLPMLVFSGLMNTGQACVAPDPHPGAAVALRRGRREDRRRRRRRMPVGLPDNAGAMIGPLISEKQRERVEGYIKKGVEEGARSVTGGGRPEGLDSGWFVEPTVFADVDNSMTIAQEEIFGPVLAVIPYDTEEDAVRIANDSVYGLAGSVCTTDNDKAMKIAVADPHRHLRGQHVRLRSGRPVRRLQELRHRPRERPGGHRAVHRRPRACCCRSATRPNRTFDRLASRMHSGRPPFVHLFSGWPLTVGAHCQSVVCIWRKSHGGIRGSDQVARQGL